MSKEDTSTNTATSEANKETKDKNTDTHPTKDQSATDQSSKTTNTSDSTHNTAKPAKDLKPADKSVKTSADSTKTATKAKTKSPKSSDVGFRITVITLLILSFFAGGTGLTLSIMNYLNQTTPITYSYGFDGNSTSFTEGSIGEVAAQVAPGVVSIVTETRSTGWFGQSSTSTSAGTGMIVTKDGYILTNKHVIDGASSIKVVLDNGETYDKVTLVGADPLNDVAFLKVNDVDNLPTVSLGDSKTIAAGQPVIAIGNALGQYQNTVTSGIVSGTGRSLTAYSSDMSSAENLTDMIQTDAAINAGNSGGPLVNAAGQVIGINTATSTDADGIGFAIPISSVKGMLRNIIENNSATRAYMGVYYVNVTPDVAVTYDLPVTSGAYLISSSNTASVISDGPGAKAGLQDEDIITKVNGVEVGKAGTVSTLIGEYAPGDTIQLTVLRDGKEKLINLTLGSYRDVNNAQRS